MLKAAINILWPTSALQNEFIKRLHSIRQPCGINNSFVANQFGYPFIDLVSKAILCLHKNEQNPLFLLSVIQILCNLSFKLIKAQLKPHCVIVDNHWLFNKKWLILDTYGSFIWLSKVNYNEQVHTLFQGSCIKLHCLNCMITPQVQMHVYTCTYLYIYDHIIYWKTLNLGAFQI